MKLREFVGDENVGLHFKGREDLPIWDEELSEEDLRLLGDPAYLARIEEEHRELQAYFTARYGNSKYRPADLAKAAAIPETHAHAWIALHGRTGKGLY